MAERLEVSERTIHRDMEALSTAVIPMLADALGWTTLCMRFDVEEEACQFALSFGSQIEVLVSQPLRATPCSTS